MNKDTVDASLKVMEHMSKETRVKVRGTVVKGTMPCPMCKTGTVRWTYHGPKSSSFYCDTPNCISGMS
jgi:hypothetical protein